MRYRLEDMSGGESSLVLRFAFCWGGLGSLFLFLFAWRGRERVCVAEKSILSLFPLLRSYSRCRDRDTHTRT
jgi:hypothetical protein